VISPASIAALELPSLLRLFAQLTVTDVGAERALGLAPAKDLEDLGERRGRFEEARLLRVEGPLIGAFDGSVGQLIERLGNPRTALDGADVLQAAALLRLAERAARRVRQEVEPPCPRLRALLAELPDTGEWTRRVGRVLDARGQVRDDASPALKKLRQRVQSLRDGLYQELQQSVARYGEHLSEETIPLHEGRLVLLLKSGARGRLDGLVHGRSGSGRSFYFEPLDAVDGNNRLRSALDEEGEERARLLGELIDGLRDLAPAVRRTAERVAELDLLQAAAEFAELAGGRLPEVAAASELRLRSARHPLLDPALADLRRRALGSAGHRQPMVPLDLDLDATRRVLVITGPNAGGKTVALKTAGLLTLAAQCGLPVPCAAGTRLPRVERLVATVGDEQDLLHDQSTFSARLLRLREAWDAAGPDALVLLDELGSGTDPDEGAALATTLLDELLRRGTLAIVTTHLTRLAALALESDGAACAAMEFDPAAGRPTYRLLPGTPGASEALALAERLGLPTEWLERARGELDPEQRRLQKLLENVERTRGELARQLAASAAAQGELEAARAQAETERTALEAERRAVARRLKGDLDAFRDKVRRELAATEARLWDELKSGRRRGVATAAADALLASAPAELEADMEDATAPLAVGGRVRHRTLGWEGRLERLERGRAEVTVLGKRMRCREEDLVGLQGEAAPPPSTRRIVRPEAPAVAAELELIGRRVEPALSELDAYLDRALLAGRETVRIVHGHGSGRLRDAVREHLAGHDAVAGHRAAGDGEGGDGATIVTLRP
jgi:DNA mismatch repair protein MutS2